MTVHRALLAESMRAEADVGGVLIDFGTADQHKYTRGGWPTSWSDPEATDEVTHATARFHRAYTDVHTTRPTAELVFRARASGDEQHVVITAGDRKLATLDLGAEWAETRVAIDPPLAAGRHEIEFAFRTGGAFADRAAFDWLWLAETAGADAPATLPRAGPVVVSGEPRRALMAPTARSYHYYLEVPPAAALVFDYGAPDGPVDYVVSVETDGAGPAELWRGTGTATWREQRIDLAAYAGKAARLTLTTTGSGGWSEPEILVADAPPAATSRTTAKNVIVIVIDTVRADAFAAFGGTTARTPAFDAFAKTAAVFTNAYNNENWTKPSVATSLSGLYPSSHDAKRDDAKLPAEVVLLPERLREAGFRTGGFVANGYISRFFGFRKGWDTFTNYIRESKPSEAEHVYRDALAWLKKNRDERFFLYLQTIDPHVTCAVDERYTGMYFDGAYRGFLGDDVTADDQIAMSSGQGDARDRAWLHALYWGEVTYHDEHMGAFLARLDELGVPEDTAIIITNDHGEELGDHGKYGHGHTLYEHMVQAPLAIRFAPRFAPGRLIDEIVEHVDLTPTILDLLGLEPPADADGVSLMPLVDGQPERRPYYAVIEFQSDRRAIRVGSWKRVRSEAGRNHLYNLAEDPGENTNVVSDFPIARRMTDVYLGEGLGMPSKRERMKDAVARRAFKAGKAKISPGMRRALEALGYFGDH